MNDTDVAGRTVQMNIAKPKRPREQEPAVGNESEKYGLKMMAELKVKKEDADALPEGQEKEGINLGLSGALTADVNTFNGVVIKYAEPPEARLPKRRWRFYVFKGEEVLPTLHLHRQSAYLIGRDRKVVAQRSDFENNLETQKYNDYFRFATCPLTTPAPANSMQHFNLDLCQKRKMMGVTQTGL